MFVANTGELAMRFNEEGINTHGSLTKSIRRPNEMTAGRLRAVATLVGMSDTKGEPLGIVISKVLSQSIPELQSFVQARGEAPATNPTKLAVQAALIRASEIGMVAKTLDTDDDDAYMVIEDSEQQHVDDNTDETSGILSPGTAAGVALLVGRISDRYKERGGSGNLSDFVAAVKKAANADSFDKVNYGGLANNLTDEEIRNYYSGVINTGTTGSVPSQPSGGGSFWDNLFNNIDNIVDGVTKVSNAVNTTVGNVQNTSTGIIDQVNQIGGGIGAASIDQYLSQNWLKVVGVMLVLIVVTIIILRVSRK